MALIHYYFSILPTLALSPFLDIERFPLLVSGNLASEQLAHLDYRRLEVVPVLKRLGEVGLALEMQGHALVNATE
jgi:hypothetical protein